MMVQMPDVIVPPRPPLPPVRPPEDPERDDPAEPDGPEDEPPPVLNRASSDPLEWLPKAYFGWVGNPDPGQPYDDHDPDDEELDVTPPDVVMMLGFDPLELSEDRPPRSNGEP